MILSWTAASYGNMQVEADGAYYGGVILEKSFRNRDNEEEIFDVGTYTGSAALDKKTIVPFAPRCTITLVNESGPAPDPASITAAAGESFFDQLPVPTHQNPDYSFDGWYTEAGEPVTAETVFYEDTTLYAHWHLPGDVNGDGKVSTKDFVTLMKLLAGEEVFVIETALDVNGDGNMSTKDFVTLMKYLAGEDIPIF